MNYVDVEVKVLLDNGVTEKYYLDKILYQSSIEEAHDNLTGFIDRIGIRLKNGCIDSSTNQIVWVDPSKIQSLRVSIIPPTKDNQ